MKARIAEVFDSVQGEGLYLGEKQIFVRFFGCNLKCQFCDTKPDRFMEYEPKELLDEINLHRRRNHHSISFTGGEPLLQKDFLKEILKLTSAAGLKNYLETNGTLVEALEEVIDYVDIVAMDLKLPSSTNMIGMWNLHYDFLKVALRKEVFLKAIICQSTKSQDLKEAVELIRYANAGAILVLQPNSYEEYNQLTGKLDEFKALCFQTGVTACVIPQMHKVMGVR